MGKCFGKPDRNAEPQETSPIYSVSTHLSCTNSRKATIKLRERETQMNRTRSRPANVASPLRCSLSLPHAQPHPSNDCKFVYAHNTNNAYALQGAEYTPSREQRKPVNQVKKAVGMGNDVSKQRLDAASKTGRFMRN